MRAFWEVVKHEGITLAQLQQSLVALKKNPLAASDLPESVMGQAMAAVEHWRAHRDTAYACVRSAVPDNGYRLPRVHCTMCKSVYVQRWPGQSECGGKCRTAKATEDAKALSHGNSAPVSKKSAPRRYLGETRTCENCAKVYRPWALNQKFCTVKCTKKYHNSLRWMTPREARSKEEDLRARRERNRRRYHEDEAFRRKKIEQVKERNRQLSLRAKGQDA